MKTELKMLLSIILIISVLLIFMIIVIELEEYLTYKQKYNDGYDVRLSFNWQFLYSCEIKTKMQDGSTNWNYCQDIGNEYAWENFAVERENEN